MRGNSIRVIQPYKWAGMWVFDDPNVHLDKEPFVGGVPEILDILLERHEITGDRFTLVFSDVEFPDHNDVIEWVREEGNGNVYRCMGMEGWLCPALLKYFDDPPQKIYIKVLSESKL